MTDAAMTRPAALVTGGSRGIGAGIVAALARDGYDVVLTFATRADDAEGSAEAARAVGVDAWTVRADAGTAEGAAAAFLAVDRHLGRLDVLVNNAGILPEPSRVSDMSSERSALVLRVNALGPLLHAALAVRRMSRRGGGTGGVIVNVSSRAAVRGAAGEFVDYAMSKAALDALTVGLATEVAPEGIRVVGVRPGIIDTEMNASHPGRIEALMGTVPLGRVGHAEEVAEAVRWLASPAASYVTGVTLDVSGGR